MLTSLLITDTNIWLDLENGNLLETVFDLPFFFVSPVFAGEEIDHEKWELLKSLGLTVYDLNPEQISEIYTLNQYNRSVSTTDLSSFILARDLSAILLSGDGALRKLAKKHAIEVHGALWLLDQLILHGIIPASRAAAVLIRMIERGARFPKNECDKRLKAWQASP